MKQSLDQKKIEAKLPSDRDHECYKQSVAELETATFYTCTSGFCGFWNVTIHIKPYSDRMDFSSLII